MERVRFGKTGLMVSKIAFGGIPIQRLGEREAADVVRGVIDLDINFIDTAQNYTTSEERIGLAIRGIPRDALVIATKTFARDKKGLLDSLDKSLKRLGTDYIDIYQHHNIMTMDEYDVIMGEDGAYEGMTEAIRAGKVRYPAFSSHRPEVAVKIMRDGHFAAVQLPFNYIDDAAAKEAIPLAKELDMGFLSMKPFGGGMLGDANLSMKYLAQFDSIVPDPGIEKLSQMEEIIRIVESGEKFSEADADAVARMKEELGASWCHRCDYCQPCPQGISIWSVLTVESFSKRIPLAQLRAAHGVNMEKARTCIKCRECVGRCPYGLSIPELITERLAFWDSL